MSDKIKKVEHELAPAEVGKLEKALSGENRSIAMLPPSDWFGWKQWGDRPLPTSEEWDAAKARWFAERDPNDMSDANWDFVYLVATYTPLAWWKYFYPDADTAEMSKAIARDLFAIQEMNRCDYADSIGGRCGLKAGHEGFHESGLGATRRLPKWETVDVPMKVSVGVSFMSAITLDMSVFGKAVDAFEVKPVDSYGQFLTEEQIRELAKKR